MNMAEHEEFLIKLDLAHDIDISNENLKKLSEDKDYIVRLALAGNPNIPKEILIKLSKDENLDVKAAVAYNSSTPIEALEELIKSNECLLKIEVASNKNTPIKLLEILSKDEHDYVKEVAFKRLEELNSPENKIESIESKISNNKTTLDELFKEKNIKPNSKVGLELLKVYNETQDKLKMELEDLKTQVVDIATNDFLER